MYWSSLGRQGRAEFGTHASVCTVYSAAERRSTLTWYVTQTKKKAKNLWNTSLL